MNRQLIYLFFLRHGARQAGGVLLLGRWSGQNVSRGVGLLVFVQARGATSSFGSRSGYVIRSTPSRSQQLVCLLRLISWLAIWSLANLWAQGECIVDGPAGRKQEFLWAAALSRAGRCVGHRCAITGRLLNVRWIGFSEAELKRWFNIHCRSNGDTSSVPLLGLWWYTN